MWSACKVFARPQSPLCRRRPSAPSFANPETGWLLALRAQPTLACGHSPRGGVARWCLTLANTSLMLPCWNAFIWLLGRVRRSVHARKIRLLARERLRRQEIYSTREDAKAGVFNVIERFYHPKWHRGAAGDVASVAFGKRHVHGPQSV